VLSVPLDNIVVADDAGMPEATDAVQVFRCWSLGGFGFASSLGEATVVVSDKALQDAVGGVQIAGAGQAEFADQAILKNAPEAFDAALGLWRIRGDVGDAELLEGAAELSGFAFTSQLFFHRPMVIVANEDTVAIPVQGQRDTEARKQAAEQVEIALGGLGGKEPGSEDFPGGIVLKTQSGKCGSAALQPVVGTAIEQEHFARASRMHTALAHARFPFTQDEMTVTRCISFALNVYVSIGVTFSRCC
jgi:hypothetical protein